MIWAFLKILASTGSLISLNAFLIELTPSTARPPTSTMISPRSNPSLSARLCFLTSETRTPCIEPKEKVWIVFIDIHILDYDGNLFDAASLASLAALFTTTVPAKRFELGDDYPLPLQEPPISCTSVKINNVVVLDPSIDEEEIANARLTVASDQNGDIRAMQKGLNGSFTQEEIQKVIKASIDNGQEIRKILYKSIGK